MELTTVKLNLRSEYWDTIPVVKVMIDYSTVLYEGEVTSPLSVEWEGHLDPLVPHTLSVFRSNKRRGDTVLNDSGDIIKDQMLIIEEVYFDDIDISPLDLQHGRYLPDLGEDIKNMKHLAWNGEWRIAFKVPTYIWLLESLNG